MSKILGLGGSSHDYSAVLMIDGEIVIGIEDERLIRRKHAISYWFEIPCLSSVNYCLEHAGIPSIDDIDFVVGGDILPIRTIRHFPQMKTVNHHLLHALSAYQFSDQKDMAVLVMDGCGAFVRRSNKIGQYENRETISFYRASLKEMACLGSTVGKSLREVDAFSRGISNSLGYLYNLITHLIGFGKRQEGKTMGLAGYGRPIYTEPIRKRVGLSDDFNSVFQIDLPNDDLIAELEAILKKNNDSFDTRADLAASIQLIFEEVLEHCSNLLLKRTGCKHIALAGGCALNSLANGKLEDKLSSKGTKLHLLPFVNDAGQAFGALAWQARKLGLEKPIRFRGSNDSVSLSHCGYEYSDSEILSALNKAYPRIEFCKIETPEDCLSAILASDKIIGYFDGGSEFGPRALGYRSILASPVTPQIRERLNREIKGREPFRPIAPIISRDKFAEYFEGPDDKPYMISTAYVKRGKAQQIPSVTHVDRTARVQTLNEFQNPMLYRLLNAFYRESGCHVLCNTSFNGPGEPIVESPENAIDCFLRLGLDFLYLQGYLVWRPKNTKVMA